MLNHKIIIATNKQIEYGKYLGINLKRKSLRVAAAMISDAIELKCWESIISQSLKKGDKVKYLGNYTGRKNKTFIINSIGRTGLVFFFVKNEFGQKVSSHAYAFYLKKMVK